MYTFKFEGLTQQDSQTPYYYGSLPAKPELGHILVFDGTGNRYVIYRLIGEGLVGGQPTDQQRELAWAEISRGESVPTIWLRKIDEQSNLRVSGRSFDYEEVKEYSQRNRETRLSAAK